MAHRLGQGDPTSGGTVLMLLFNNARFTVGRSVELQ